MNKILLASLLIFFVGLSLQTRAKPGSDCAENVSNYLQDLIGDGVLTVPAQRRFCHNIRSGKLMVPLSEAEMGTSVRRIYQLELLERLLADTALHAADLLPFCDRVDGP